MSLRLRTHGPWVGQNPNSLVHRVNSHGRPAAPSALPVPKTEVAADRRRAPRAAMAGACTLATAGLTSSLHAFRRRPRGGQQRISRRAIQFVDVEGASTISTAAGLVATMPSNALAALLALDAAVIFHESGHFFCARSVGLPVEEFSVGFGPRIIGARGADTDFVLRLLPIGGYVRFDDAKTVELSDGAKLNKFDAMSPAARLWVLAGGVISNLVTAWSAVCAAALTVGVGKPTPLPGVRVSSVTGEALERTRLQNGDVLMRIGELDLSAPGQSVTTVVDFIHKLPAATPVELLVQRGTETLSLAVLPLSDLDTGFQRLGVQIITNTEQSVLKAASFNDATVVASDTTWGILSEQVAALQSLANRSGAGEIVGPVGIMEQGERLVSTDGVLGVILFFVTLNLNLALLNALPVPGLDGGKAVFVLAEQALGKRLNEDAKAILEVVFVVAILFAVLGLTFKDVLRLVGN